MRTLRHATISLGAFAMVPLAAYAQAPAPHSTTVTTTTSRMSAPADLNTNTNSQPDSSATAGYSNTDVRIRGRGNLNVAMANFSVRTGIEIRPNQNAQVVVQSVRSETPAARAGVEPRDVITKVDGREVATIDAFQKLLMGRPTKGAFMLSLQRGDQSFRVPLGRQLTLMGMTLFPDEADRPVVAEVDPSSPAAFGGFQVGDMIVGFNRQFTPSMDRMMDFGVPFIRHLPAGQGIAFQVARDGKLFQFSVTRPADADLPPLTPDQERHLSRLGMGGVAEPAPRHVISQTTTSVTQTVNPLVGAVVPVEVPVGAGPVPQSLPYSAGVTYSGGSATVGGIDNLGLGLPTGNVAGVGPAPEAGPPDNEFGPLRKAPAAVAVLYGAPSNMVQQTFAPSPNAPSVSTVTATTPGMNAGVVGFVQIQLTVPPNPNPSGPTLSQAPPTVPQSIVTARVTGVPAGVYTVAVHQYGDCGDLAGASAGPPAITLGSMVVDANGQGQLQAHTVSHTPQAFLGRVVSLVPAGVLPRALPAGPPQPTPPVGVQANASLIACGVFGLSNPRRPFLANNMPAGVPGTTVTTGSAAPEPPAPPRPAPPGAAPPSSPPQPDSP